MMRVPALVLAIAVLACASQPKREPLAAPSPVVLDSTPHAVELIALALRRVIDSTLVPRGLLTRNYCVSIGSEKAPQDPPQRLLDALGDLRPSVFAASDCDRDPAGASRFYVRRTGQRAVWVFATLPRMTDSVHARVDAAYWLASMDGAGWWCQARYSASTWQLTGCRLSWAS